MNCINIQGKKRKEIKKKYNSELINYGYIPCIIYSKNKNIKFYVLLSILKKIILTYKVYKVILEIKNENKIEAILKEIQFHPINDEIIHVDFLELKKDKYLIISIPIISVGHSLGVSKGGEYKLFLNKIKIKIITDDLLDHIDLNINNLDIGDSLYIKNIYNPKYIILHNSNEVIASIKSSRTYIKEGQGHEK